MTTIRKWGKGEAGSKVSLCFAQAEGCLERATSDSMAEQSKAVISPNLKEKGAGEAGENSFFRASAQAEVLLEAEDHEN